MLRRCVLLRRPLQLLLAGAAATVVMAFSAPGFSAERGFPFDSEIMLDAKPMKGSKRVPVIGIGPNGEASMDLWCNSTAGRFVVVDNTVTVITGTRTDRQCDAARMRGDDDFLAALAEVTTWSRAGDLVTLQGARTLRFRVPTN
jgi:heat shock protein HslJ